MTKRRRSVRILFVRGHSSSGRAPPCQGGGSEFEPRCPLQSETGHLTLGVLFFSTEKRTRCLRPRREAPFQSEVRQGSCEWPQAICGMPGSEFKPAQKFPSPLRFRLRRKLRYVIGISSLSTATRSAGLTAERERGTRGTPPENPTRCA